ncbi:MAG: complex I subunit 5 family protein [Nocardioidaceae bacterium]
MSTAALASLLPLPVVFPITGAVLALLLSRLSKSAALVVSLVAMAGATLVLALFAPRVFSGDVISHYLGNWGPVHGTALGVAFAADAFGLTYALLVAVIGMVLLLYTMSELRGLGAHEMGGYACLFQLLLAALIGSALAADTIDVFVWFEVAALASYGLTGFFLERPIALEAAFKIMVLTNIAAFCVFVGSSLIYSRHGALNFGQVHTALAGDLHDVDLVALGLLVAGFATKAGLMPFHGWLADAHTAAPGPVSALFSGLMVNLGIVAIVRFMYDVYDATNGALPILLTVMGAVSAVVGAALALAQDDLKRLLAYDTVSQMGVLMVGFGVGSTSAAAGATYHLVDHALFKTLLFLSAGAIVHATGMTKLSQMGGLAHHRPGITVAFLVGAAAIAGVPPLNGYVSLGLIHDALLSGHPATFAVMILAQVLTVAALARATYLAFFRRRDDDYDSFERLRPGMIVSFASLALGCLAFGVLPSVVLDHVAAPAAAVLTESSGYSAGILAGQANLHVTSVSFDYFAASGLLISVGTVAAGLLVAWWYVRRTAEPWPVHLLRRLHTGSVNDYAAYSVFGLTVTIVALLAGR